MSAGRQESSASKPPASDDHGPYERYREAWAALNPTQKARVMLKQQWEQCTRLAAFADWPSLFDPDREQDHNELVACRKLIAQRPDLFPESVEDGSARRKRVRAELKGGSSE